MKISGFTFIRNAIQYDYPIQEAISSILPLCDEVVVAVGQSTDATLELIKNIDSAKIKIVPTIWDDSLREGGRVLAAETNKAFQAVAADSDWAFYIQGDEVVHEKYLDNIHAAMNRWKDDPKVDGLLFNYQHFYGSYDYVGESSKWYRREIRVVRNDKNIYSYRDAQGFRKGQNEKLRVKLIDAEMYHYGWVKHPQAMQKKQETFQKLWHDDQWINQNMAPAEAFDYSEIDALRLFAGTHPQTMLARIAQKNWAFDYDISKNNMAVKEQLKKWVRDTTGWHIGEYRNYKLV
jgi:glycosyltransferase involved in cell wall biosynthesis